MDTDVVIVGAGLSGLVAANTLQSGGVSVTVCDKGRSVGGRLATRRIGDGGLADHGAQFFTVRTNIFREQVLKWIDEDLVYIWGHGWSDGSIKRTMPDGHPRYVTRGGMNQLAKVLAQPLQDVRTGITIDRIEQDGQLWRLYDSDHNEMQCRGVILTPPVPQSLALLPEELLTKPDRQALRRIEYGSCLCGLFLVDGAVELPDPGALQDFNQTIYWIADNRAKGISSTCVVTMHADARWSRRYYDEPDDAALSQMQERLQPYLTDGSTVRTSQLKKWRYSIPITTHPRDYLQAEGLSLIFAGDAFGGRGRVEGAYLSGLHAGKAMIAYLTT